MTTASWSTVVDHTSDAGFRAWGSEIGVKLAAVGLVQTADTGQINWASVTRPAANTSGGYEIWRFADSSLYLKIEYGTGASANIPQMWRTTGTGSNGSGTITGQTDTRNIFTTGAVPNSTATVYTSYVCHVADAFSFQWKHLGLSGNYLMGLMAVGKSVDGTGAATSTGFGSLRMQLSSGGVPLAFQSVRTAATAATGTEHPYFGVIPGVPASSIDGSGNYQAYEVFLTTPNVTPFNWVNIVLLADISRGFTFSVVMVGSTPHTYMCVGQINPSASFGTSGGPYAANYASVAVIYE